MGARGFGVEKPLRIELACEWRFVGGSIRFTPLAIAVSMVIAMA